MYSNRFLLREHYGTFKSFTLLVGMCETSCPTVAPISHQMLLNDQVDRLVRRADIFEATTSGDRAPHGSMELEDESRGDGVDVARNDPGDLRSRQKKRKRRKLAWSTASPPLSPDTQPVWEERTPARPALFQVRYWRDLDYWLPLS